MAVETDVINDALTEIGAYMINDPSEASEQASRASFLFPRVVRSELRKHAWSFAMNRTALPASATPPAWGYQVAYPLPPDFLRMWQVGQYYYEWVLRDYVGEDLSVYAIEGNQVLTNLPAPLNIRYISDVTNNVNIWDALFREVISLKLGLKLVPSLTRSDTKYKTIMEAYEGALKTAKRINAIELPPTPQSDDSWTFGRF